MSGKITGQGFLCKTDPLFHSNHQTASTFLMFGKEFLGNIAVNSQNNNQISCSTPENHESNFDVPSPLFQKVSLAVK